jgi:tetratricopeptide (TPR) repeat protein
MPQRSGSQLFTFGSRLPTCVTSLLAIFVVSARIAAGQTTNPRQLFQDALIAQQRGEDTVAVRDYQELIRIRPDLTAAHANLAAALSALGRLPEAIAQYRIALKQAPGNRQLELNLAIADFKNSDTTEAAGLLRSLHAAQPGNERIAILLGDCELRLGRDAQTVALLKPLEAADPNNLDLEWALGSALVGAGQPAMGVKRVQMVAETGHSAEAYMLAAQTYLTLQQFKVARQDAEAATRLNPRLPGLDTLTGTIMDDFGNSKGAEAAFEKAIASNPNDFTAQVRLGGVLYSQRQLTAAKQHLDRAIDLQPFSSLAHYERGRVERAQGKLRAAMNDFEAAEREKPGWLPPHIELAALYYRLHRRGDGARGKRIVDRLSAEEQQRKSKLHVIAPGVPAP